MRMNRDSSLSTVERSSFFINFLNYYQLYTFCWICVCVCVCKDSYFVRCWLVNRRRSNPAEQQQNLKVGSEQ